MKEDFLLSPPRGGGGGGLRFKFFRQGKVVMDSFPSSTICNFPKKEIL